MAEESHLDLSQPEPQEPQKESEVLRKHAQIVMELQNFFIDEKGEEISLEDIVAGKMYKKASLVSKKLEELMEVERLLKK